MKTCKGGCLYFASACFKLRGGQKTLTLLSLFLSITEGLKMTWSFVFPFLYKLPKCLEYEFLKMTCSSLPGFLFS